MKIAVYGCGAMGVAIGALLSQAGIPADLIDANEKVVHCLNEKGATLTGYEQLQQPVHAYLPEQMEGIYDYIILAVKQTVTDEAAKNIIPHFDEHSSLITIQDGFPEPYLASLFPPNQIIGAVCN